MVTNSRISELMDGELSAKESTSAFAMLGNDQSAMEAWRAYHLIGDIIRNPRDVTADFARAVSARLELEPTVLAPGIALPKQDRVRWIAMSAAASLGAILLVGWLAFAPLPEGAATIAPVAMVPEPAKSAQKPEIVPLPSAADDYLLAHEGYSPRVSLQGMAPYVRTVAAPAHGDSRP